MHFSSGMLGSFKIKSKCKFQNMIVRNIFMPILVGFAQSTARCWDMYYIFKVNSSVYGYCIIFFLFIRWCIESSSFCTKKMSHKSLLLKILLYISFYFLIKKTFMLCTFWHKGLAILIRPCFLTNFIISRRICGLCLWALGPFLINIYFYI